MMRWDDDDGTDHVENPFVNYNNGFHDDDGGGASGYAYGSGGGPSAVAPLHHGHDADASAAMAGGSYGGYGSPQPRTPHGGRRRRAERAAGRSTPTAVPSTDRTPLFGGGRGGYGYSPSMAALRASRGRERRRLLGRLAVRATGPGALSALAAVALIFGVVQWRSGVPPADAEAMLMSERQPMMSATLNGRNVRIVQPSNLQAKRKPKGPPPPAPWEGVTPEQLPKPDRKRRMEQALEQQQPEEAEAAMGRTRTGRNNNKKTTVVQKEEEKVERMLDRAQDAERGLISKVKDLAFGPKKEKGFKPKPLDKKTRGGDSAGVVFVKDKHGKKTVILLPKPKRRAEEEQQQQQDEASMGSTRTSNKDARHKKKDVPESDGIVRPAVLTKTEGDEGATATAAATTAEAVPYGASKTTIGNKNNKQQNTNGGEHHTAWEIYAGPLGEKDASASSNGDGDDVVTYYYDPPMGSAPGGPPPPEPETVYDGDGNPVPLVDLHEGGKNDVFLVPPGGDHPPTPPGEESKEASASSSSSSTTSRNAKAVSGNGGGSSYASTSSGGDDGDAPTQDQLIVVATVATMALLVGALSARRLRSRQFLNSCIENESLEDELAYDAAHTQTGSILGGAAGYDTFAAGSIKWRGDLEKFDV